MRFNFEKSNIIVKTKQIFFYILLLFATLQLSCVALDIDTICGSGCTEADNATMNRDYAEGLCYDKYQQDIVFEQCGGSDIPYVIINFFVLKTESGKYCFKFFIQGNYIPSQNIVVY